MRVFAAVILLVIAGAAPAAAQTASPTDRARDLAGTWSCESVAHSMGTMTFAAQPDGTLVMRNLFQTPGGLTGEWDEVYSRDRATGNWSVKATELGHTGFIETGTAGPWTADAWNFEGTLDQATLKRPLRLVYTTLAPTAFRRDVELLQNDRWVSTSASTCTRD